MPLISPLFFGVFIPIQFLSCTLQAKQKPNIIIYTDDQGTLDTRSYGANDLYTPNIDRLGKTGIRFIQAYAHTVCCPSRASMITGRYPQRSGINNFPQNETRDQIITCMDFLPTICEITGSKLPDCVLDGFSLLPVIKSKKAQSNHKILYFQWEDQWAVREGKWKLIVKGRDTTGKFSSHPQKEAKMESPYLGNLEAENPEEHNYASEHPEIVERLTKLHTDWASGVFK